MKWIFSHTGKHVHLLDHQPDPIVLADIAHGLSHKCRFSALMHNAALRGGEAVPLESTVMQQEAAK